jgi:hypothetical protein
VVENRGTLVTSSGDDDIPLARSGFINYDLVSTAPAGGDYQVVSQLDSGLAGGVLLPIHATLAVSGVHHPAHTEPDHRHLHRSRQQAQCPGRLGQDVRRRLPD